MQFETSNKDPATFANGQQLLTASRSYLNFYGAPKSCKFLFKYDDTIWKDAENYYSDFSESSDISNPFCTIIIHLDVCNLLV